MPAQSSSRPSSELNWAPWFRRWLGKFFLLLSFWFSVSFWLTQSFLQKELQNQMEIWSEELGLEHLSSSQKVWSQKILHRIQQDQRFILTKGLGYRNPKGQEIWGHRVKLPVQLYNIPAGELEFILPYRRVLGETLHSPVWWWGGLILGSLYTLLDILRWLLGQVKNQNRMMQEHLEFRKKLTSQILHDLKSPLTLLRTLAETDTELPPDEYKLYLQKLDQRLQNILSELQWKPFQTETALPKIPLSQVTETLDHLIFQISKETGQTIVLTNHLKGHSTNTLFICGHPNLVLRILQNLLVNAAEANQERQHNQIRVELQKEDSYLVVHLRDQGPGFQCSFENLPYVSSSKGSTSRGSGLKIIHEALSVLEGRVDFYKEPQGGTLCKMKIPMGNESSPL